MNLEALKHYLESRFIGSSIVSQEGQMTVKYRNSEGLLFIIIAQEETDGLSLKVTTPLMLLNPRTREKFDHLQAGLAGTLSKGLFENLGVNVDHESHVCAWVNLGMEPLSFPNKIVETFVEGALGLPVAFKKSLF
jgi:hypothetical protein